MTSAVRPRNVKVLGVMSDKNPKFQPLLGKNVSREFLKSPFLYTVEIKIVSSPLDPSGNFDFTEESQYFIERHIRKHVFHWKAYKKAFLLAVAFDI